MDPQKTQNAGRAVWGLARRQHYVVTRRQLIGLGVHPDAIKHRLASGPLHPVHAGVYAVGRRELARLGELVAAVLACGDGAVLGHAAAGELWGIVPRGRLEVIVPPGRSPRRPGIIVHRTALAAAHIARRHSVPVTTPTRTLIDVAPYLQGDLLERAVNEADRLDLIDPERLRESLKELTGTRGVAKLRSLLDRRTFTLTDSALERSFKPIARTAGLPQPLTQQWVNGFRVDFFWPQLGLVVETDGLRYHRTAAQQSRAHLRDQAHLAAGLQPLRFTHAQVAYDKPHVEAMLRIFSSAPEPPGNSGAPRRPRPPRR